MSKPSKKSSHTLLRNVVRYWWPLVIWMALIFYLSSQPDLPSAPEPWFDTLLKKGGHFTVYAMLAFWWWRALHSMREMSEQREISGVTLIVAFAMSVLYGVSDELHQGFVPGRHASPTDVLIDAAGAATALLLLWRWKHRWLGEPDTEGQTG